MCAFSHRRHNAVVPSAPLVCISGPFTSGEQGFIYGATYVTTHSNNFVISLLWSRDTPQCGPQCYRQCIWDCMLWHYKGTNPAVQPYEGFHTVPLHICSHCRYDNRLLVIDIQNTMKWFILLFVWSHKQIYTWCGCLPCQYYSLG